MQDRTAARVNRTDALSSVCAQELVGAEAARRRGWDLRSQAVDALLQWHY